VALPELSREIGESLVSAIVRLMADLVGRCDHRHEYNDRRLEAARVGTQADLRLVARSRAIAHGRLTIDPYRKWRGGKFSICAVAHGRVTFDRAV
jgi:hypothetical protein